MLLRAIYSREGTSGQGGCWLLMLRLRRHQSSLPGAGSQGELQIKFLSLSLKSSKGWLVQDVLGSWVIKDLCSVVGGVTI